MDERKGVIKEFLQLVAGTFTVFTLIMSIVGWIVSDDAQGVTAIFGLGGTGLRYEIIFSLILFSIVNSGLSVLITTVFKKLMMLWQMLITLFACLTASCIMVAAFRWIPLDTLRGWLWFIGSFVVSFIAIAVIMITKTVLDNKRLEKQLSDYKAKFESKEKNL